MILELVKEAVAAGAREERAADVLGLSARTLARWRLEDGGDDGRQGPVSAPANKLDEQERQRVLETANSVEFRDLSPRQIVPRLADAGRYIASESTFYRVLREAGQMAHRSSARPAKANKPKEYVAQGPNEVWSWDITYLRSSVRGAYYYLYLIVDIYSRKIVNWEVHPEESAQLAAMLVKSAVAKEEADPTRLVLHADNGGPMKGSTMLATLQRLGVVPSFSRPSVSDDNPFAEALFRTLKYRPGYPSKPFATIESARDWVQGFVTWYNSEHLHSGIRYVTPNDRHAGRDKPILARRHELYTQAKKQTPERWSGPTRNWTPIGAVYLNPVKQETRIQPIATPVS